MAAPASVKAGRAVAARGVQRSSTMPDFSRSQTASSRAGLGHGMKVPPLTSKTAPVTKDEASDARNETTEAISPGSP